MAKKLAFDRVLFTTVIVLVLLGLTMVYSASAVVDGGRGGHSLLYRQLLAAALGLAVMWVAMHLEYRHWGARPVVWMLVVAALTLLVLTLVSPELNRAQRWLLVAGMSFQPSELAKVVLVIFLAYQIAKRPEERLGGALILPAALVAGPMTALVFLGRDLAGALLLVLAAALMLLLAGTSWLYLAMGSLSLTPLVVSAIVWAPYRRQRLLAFLNPDADPLGGAFQPSQSLIAVGSGGLFGLGLGKSLQKLYFLPYPHSDFVFAIVGEELGLAGALGVVALFGVLLWRGIRAGFRAPDRFGRFLAWGLTGLLVIQALIHMSVAVALLPTTGITLPFISYGGSSLVVSLFACGVLLNVSQHG